MSASTGAGSVLTEVLPDRARRYVYLGYSAVVVLLGGIQVGYASASAGLPLWVKIAQDVTLYAGAVLGLTAAANTPKERGRYAARE